MERRARKRLAGFRARNLHTIVESDGPTVVIANHSSWWDAVLPIIISFRYYDLDAYGVMEKEQLDKYRFFRSIGMLEVDRERPRGALATIHDLGKHLSGSDRLLWYFPQGKLVPNDRRPIEFERGIVRLLRTIDKPTVIPCGFRFETFRNERPMAYCTVAPPIVYGELDRLDDNGLLQRLQVRMTETLDELRGDIINESLEDYDWIVRGRRSINEVWDAIRGVD